MTTFRLLGFFLSALVGIILSFSPAFADDVNTASLDDVHKTLLLASGYQAADNPPTIAQQTELLNKALKMLDQVPHVYHGQLKRAKDSIEAALGELSTGDTAHKARSDMLDADEQIKSLL